MTDVRRNLPVVRSKGWRAKVEDKLSRGSNSSFGLWFWEIDRILLLLAVLLGRATCMWQAMIRMLPSRGAIVRSMSVAPACVISRFIVVTGWWRRLPPAQGPAPRTR